VFHADMMGDAPIERLVLPIWSTQTEPLDHGGVLSMRPSADATSLRS
jgi:hypothetical protein